MLEGLIFLFSGLLGLLDTVSPHRMALARSYGDVIGFIIYVGFLSVGLVIGGGVLCIKNRGDLGKLWLLFKGNFHFQSARKVITYLLEKKAAIMFFALSLYALITPYLGYALTTFLFFLGIFGWQGYKWSLRNLLLSLITAVAFTAFARIADIPIPMGFVALW